jgi:hypothetical protein
MKIGAGMVGRWIFAGALGLAVSASGALADQAAPQAEPGPTCDFFQAELIGVLCGHTAFVAPGVTGGGETINRTTTSTPAPVAFHGGGHGGFHGGGGGGTTSERWNYQNTYEAMTLAVSPWQGVRFHVTGEAFQYNDSYSSLFMPGGGGFHSPTPTNTSFSGSYGGWQEIGAAATLTDTQIHTPFGAMHYVVDVIGNLDFLPGGGLYQQRDLQQLGWQSGAALPLGGSGLSLTYLSANLFERIDNPGFFEIQNTTRLLLADDAYGWAIGPRLDGTTVLWHAPGVNTGWLETRLGGEALLEPFRRTSFPILRDLTLDLKATHSLGQAALVPNWAGNASAYDYAATARVNFRF